MKVASLFSGGKDSAYSAYLAKQSGHELVCLVTVISKNKESYMFHTPNIKWVKKQARVMNLPLIKKKTKGKKEEELDDLEIVIKQAKEKYEIGGVVTGALYSEYQVSRIKKICNKLRLECINPLWHKEEIAYLWELVKSKFKVIVIGIAAYPLNESWLGKEIDEKFIEEAKELEKTYKIHPAGEGGEFETFVLNCPLFEKELKVKSFRDVGEKNSWRRDIRIFP
jgi:asparagine synthase (glutamine-hydrolysing)